MPEIRVINPYVQNEQKTRVAAYCRVSSDSCDQLHSFAAQVKFYTEYIGENPQWFLADIYADEGLTGTEMTKREDFNRLISDCRKGKIDRLLTKSISRFARNVVDCLKVARQLKEYGVSILFEKENIDTAYMSSEMLLAISGAQAQEESISISKNIRMSIRKRMAQGTYIASSAPYGYRLVNNELEIIPEQAEIVKLIYDSFLSGMGKKKIADMLNDKQIPHNQNGKKWHITAISYILSNERYVGDALFQKSYQTETLPFKKKTNDGELDKYYVESINPAIISKDTFYAAQSLKEKRSASCSTKPQPRPLTGKIMCACGHCYRQISDNEIIYWECRKHNFNSSECSSRRIPETDIYNAFVSMINKLTLNREYILLSIIKYTEQMNAKNGGTQGRVHEIDRQIRDYNAQSLALSRLKTKGFIDASDFMMQSNQIGNFVSKLRAERRQLMQDDETDEMLYQLKILNSIIENTESCITEFNESLFNDIVKQIIVPSKTEISFKMLGELTFTEKIEYSNRRCNKA
ncbi:MAG: recombinase family protein [Oscillospiraceae bacterium]